MIDNERPGERVRGVDAEFKVVPIRIGVPDRPSSVDIHLPSVHGARPICAGTDMLASPTHDHAGRVLPPHDAVDILVDYAGLVHRLGDDLHAVPCAVRRVENGRVPKCHVETAAYLAVREGWSFMRLTERHLLVPLGCNNTIWNLESISRRHKRRESVPNLLPVFRHVHVT